MGDHTMKKTTLTKPRVDLEELYQGIPDESVNLTFQDLADLNASEKRIRSPITITQPIPEELHHSPSPLAKLPSLDFSKGLHASANHHHHGGHVDVFGGDKLWGPYGHASGGRSPRGKASGDGHLGYSMGHDDDMSRMSTASGRGGGRRRRPGIPHSKICTICSTYTYVLRTRCLVCGRVYCRQCVEMGMGEMVEGRKCIECLGLRFSQRYIEKAGKIGWCYSWRYPSTVKQAELKWAEKGPRRSRDKGYNSHYSGMMSSRSRSPVTPRTHHHGEANSHEPSFVMSSSYSPYSTPLHHQHHLPL